MYLKQQLESTDNKGIEMKIDQEYLSTLMKPLTGGFVLTLLEYLEKLEVLGIDTGSEEFSAHLKNLCNKKMISNLDGATDPRKLGFSFSPHGEISSINSSMKIMVAEKEETAMAQNFNIENFNAQNAQLGNGNTQNVTINMQELVEKVAASDDPEAKGMLMKLLENPTISGVIGAGVTGLIGLLGGG
jgi:hypothetical protein